MFWEAGVVSPEGIVPELEADWGGRSPQRRGQRRRGRRGRGRRRWGRGSPASGASGRKARRPSSDGRRRGGGSVTGQPGVESGRPPARWGAGFGPIQIERWRWDRGKYGDRGESGGLGFAGWTEGDVGWATLRAGLVP